MAIKSVPPGLDPSRARPAIPRPGGPRPASRLVARLDSPTLPELEPEIVPDDLRAAAVLYYAAQLDRLHLFTVADRVVRMFQDGLLAVPPGELILAYAQTAASRPDAEERAATCARAVGQGPGASRSDANRDAPALLDLWLSATAALPPEPEAAAASARALAANLSRRHSPLVREIHEHLTAAVELLSDPGVLLAFEARDMWHVVERISSQYLAQPVDVARLRSRAVTGTAALEWLADHAAVADWTPDEPLIHLAGSWLAVNP